MKEDGQSLNCVVKTTSCRQNCNFKISLDTFSILLKNKNNSWHLMLFGNVKMPESIMGKTLPWWDLLQRCFNCSLNFSQQMSLFTRIFMKLFSDCTWVQKAENKTRKVQFNDKWLIIRHCLFKIYFYMNTSSTTATSDEVIWLEKRNTMSADRVQQYWNI